MAAEKLVSGNTQVAAGKDHSRPPHTQILRLDRLSFPEDLTMARVSHAALAGEETFGPVVSLYRVASDDEAVARANEGTYGLSASIWSRDTSYAEAMAQRVRSGSVNVNDGAAAMLVASEAAVTQQGLKPNVLVESTGLSVPVGIAGPIPDLQRDTAIRLISTTGSR